MCSDPPRFCSSFLEFYYFSVHGGLALLLLRSLDLEANPLFSNVRFISFHFHWNKIFLTQYHRFCFSREEARTVSLTWYIRLSYKVDLFIHVRLSWTSHVRCISWNKYVLIIGKRMKSWNRFQIPLSSTWNDWGSLRVKGEKCYFKNFFKKVLSSFFMFSFVFDSLYFLSKQTRRLEHSLDKDNWKKPHQSSNKHEFQVCRQVYQKE